VESLGGISALGSALCFAIASVFFRRVGKEVHPVIITIIKSLIACILSIVTLLLIGDPDLWINALPQTSTSFQISTNDLWLLIFSGFLGITIGDTAYFATLNALGTRRTLLLDTLSPATTSILAVIILGEIITLDKVLAIAIILCSVGWVMREKIEPSDHNPPFTKYALALGITNVFCHAMAVITAKEALENTPSLEASIIRQGTAMLTLILWTLLRRQFYEGLSPLLKWSNTKMLIGASFCGSFMGIWLGLFGLKLAPASIATTLNSTTPLFILPINKFFEKHAISRRSIAGAILAFCGAAYLII
jgi:drug/metabolite transporter (DMT)-like permease